MPGYISIYDGLWVAPASVESFKLNYREARTKEKIYTIEIVFKSGHKVKFDDITEQTYAEIVEKLKKV